MEIPPFELRTATPADAPRIARLIHDHLGPVVNAAWQDPQGSQRVLDYITQAGTCFLAEVDGQPAGLIHLDARAGELHIGAMVVEPPFRRQGLGRRLVAWAEEHALRLGLPCLGLWAQTNNPAALQLYRSAGFEAAGSPRVNTVAMRKPVQPPADRLHPLRLLHTMARGARAAGEEIRRAFRHRTVAAQKSARDVLTEADLAAERAILAVLREQYPDFNYYAEESGEQRQGSAYTFMVDPLDGTNNFVLGIPYFSTSIALLREGRPVLGLVCQPVLGEIFTAQSGAGAWHDTQPLQPRRAPAELDRAVLSWVQGHQVGSDAAAALRQGLEQDCRRLISTWAPALDWCLLARGDISALISYDSEPEDQYAGALVAREAGIRITDFAGRPWEPGQARVLAAGHPDLHQALLARLRPARSAR